MTRFITAFVALVLTAPSLWAEDTPVTLAATEYPPFYGAELEDNGFMTMIIREAFERAGFEPDVTFLPWARAFDGTRDGKYDALFTMWHRAEREEHFIFSEALPSNELVFLVRKDSGESLVFDGYGALKGKRIGFVRGYAAPPGFEEAGLRVSEAGDDLENLRKLLRGRVDMVLTDRIVAQHIMNTELGDDADSLAWVEPPVHADIQYLVVSRKAPNAEALIDGFNGALAAMTSDGTLGAIMEKHGF